MQITSTNSSTALPFLAQANGGTAAPPALDAVDKASPELREAFSNFVGQTFYSQLLGSLRKTVDKPAYFHGGRAEEIFQGQLDQTLAEDMTKATADQFVGPMYELFLLGRPQ